ncbi:hypothetical protein [Methylotenera sp.]|uniref:hypothetical protein n=1 Tax=Methylotenera sp. TaxID=2051956 RepID=UPI002488E246|nr:hypothetical protein [Methylotenera sp.]MDI1362685.1 hypothetical protein [Methylotenera sp.]
MNLINNNTIFTGRLILKNTLVAVLVLLAAITCSVESAYAGQVCNMQLNKTISSVIECNKTNLEARKLDFIETASNNPNEYSREHAKRMINMIEGWLDSRTQLLAEVRTHSINSVNAKENLLKMMERENQAENKLFEIEQEYLQSRMKSLESPSVSVPTTQKNLDITCEQQHEFISSSGPSVRCRQY